jgi:hypothetical protein
MKKVFIVWCNPNLIDEEHRVFTNLTWAYKFTSKRLEKINVEVDLTYNQVNRLVKKNGFTFLGSKDGRSVYRIETSWLNPPLEEGEKNDT